MTPGRLLQPNFTFKYINFYINFNKLAATHNPFHLSFHSYFKNACPPRAPALGTWQTLNHSLRRPTLGSIIEALFSFSAQSNGILLHMSKMTSFYAKITSLLVRASLLINIFSLLCTVKGSPQLPNFQQLHLLVLAYCQAIILHCCLS